MIPKSSYKKLLNQAPTIPMLFAKSKSLEEISLQLGSEILKDQRAIARIIPKITKNKFITYPNFWNKKLSKLILKNKSTVLVSSYIFLLYPLFCIF